MAEVKRTDAVALGKDVTAKRKRVVTARPTRNGCKTCRIRRVKCDEGRPACVKCTSTGRPCNGYDALPPRSKGASRPLLPASRSPSASGDDALSSRSSSSQTLAVSPYYQYTVTPSPPPSTLSFSITDTERSAFEFFYMRMAGPLIIMSPAKGWVQQALQVSSASKAVFHGIAALSSANLAMASIQHPTFAGLSRPERHAEALIQYSKTVTALQRQIREVMEENTPLEPVLITCLLLMCYELHAERSSMAIRHHTMGHDILKKHLKDRNRGSVRNLQSPDSLQELADTFTKLAVGSNYPGQDNASCKTTNGDAQQSVSSLVRPRELWLLDAWDELDQLIDAGKQLLGELYQYTARRVTAIYGESLDPSTRCCLTSCWSRSIKLPVHDTLLIDIKRLLDAHHQWTTAMIGIQEAHPGKARAIALLHIRHWLSSFTLETCRESRETSLDVHEADFNRVLDLAKFYLDSDTLACRPMRPRSMFGNGQDDDFCLEEGILASLYIVSLKSRTSTTRHRAVEILANSKRREGLGSSTISAQLAVAIVRVEEERARAMLPTSQATALSSPQVPEVARFTDTVRAAGEDIHRPTCLLTCARYLHESDGTIELTRYISKGPCFPYSKCAGKCRTGFHFESLGEPMKYELFAQS